MTQAMVLHQQSEIVITSMTELKDLARMAAVSKLYNGVTPEQALLLMMTGRDLGFSYAQSMRMFHIINGKATLTADAMAAVCLARRDLCTKFRRVSDARDMKKAIWETARVGDDKPHVYEFTWEDAEKAGLPKRNPTWNTWPARMLSARAKAFLAHDVYPELLAGIADPEESAELVSIPAQHVPAPHIRVVQVPEAPMTPTDEFQADIDAALDDLYAARGKSDVDAVTSRLAARKPPIPKAHPRRPEIHDAVKAANRLIAEGQALAAQQAAQDEAEAAEANADAREPGSDG